MINVGIISSEEYETKSHKNQDYNDEYDEPYYYNEESTYDRYNGTYAQDVEGWSDQDIDDVLDGNPEAYWNIDKN